MLKLDDNFITTLAVIGAGSAMAKALRIAEFFEEYPPEKARNLTALYLAADGVEDV